MIIPVPIKQKKKITFQNVKFFGRFRPKRTKGLNFKRVKAHKNTCKANGLNILP